MIPLKYTVLAILLVLLPALCAGAVTSSAGMTTNDTFSAANALYSKSVDLANEGKYQDALDAADEALALNATAINHVIQANRAGILVMLGRYDDAVAAADAALAVEGNLTVTRAIAYYNRGNALLNLGRIDEARDAFEKAYALDNTLVPPADLNPATKATTAPAPTKSPVPPVLGITGVAAGFLLFRIVKKP